LYDEETGLVRFGARDYDPTVGRWTNKDPIRWEGGQANLYVYVGNGPVGSIDPTGTSVWDALEFVAATALHPGQRINTAVGLALGILGSDSSTRLTFGNGSLQFEGNRLVTLGSPNTQAVTLGNVIVYRKPSPDKALQEHERQHVFQGYVLGASYIPLHLINQLIIGPLFGLDHHETPLECGPSANPPRPF
jgi:RHS repeat-associated protein